MRNSFALLLAAMAVVFGSSAFAAEMPGSDDADQMCVYKLTDGSHDCTEAAKSGNLAVTTSACDASTAVAAEAAVRQFSDSGLILPVAPEFKTRVITAKDVQAAKEAGQNVFEFIFGAQAENVSRFNRLDPRFARAGRKIKVPDLPPGVRYTPLPTSYPPAAGLLKFILIDRGQQFVGLYQCGQLFDSFPISSGRKGHATPTGVARDLTRQPPRRLSVKGRVAWQADQAAVYRISRRARYHESSKYMGPNGKPAPMPFAVNFLNGGYWIHVGNLPGHPDSHGCVRTLPTDAPKIFSWADKGTPVKVVSSLRP